MFRVVLDPGVLIAAVLSPKGAPAELLRHWLAGEGPVKVALHFCGYGTAHWLSK
jgi:predicted nucleic acid-binding protein